MSAGRLVCDSVVIKSKSECKSEHFLPVHRDTVNHFVFKAALKRKADKRTDNASNRQTDKTYSKTVVVQRADGQTYRKEKKRNTDGE